MDFQQQQQKNLLDQTTGELYHIWMQNKAKKRKTYEKKVCERNETGIEKTKTKETMQKKLIIFFL